MPLGAPWAPSSDSKWSKNHPNARRIQRGCLVDHWAGDASGKQGATVALHIARIEIENFRNFAHLTIDPFPSAAVIVGENGAGKSNLLHALRIVIDPTLPDAARRLRAEDFHEGPQGTSMSAGGTITIKVDFAGYEDDVSALAVLADAPVPGKQHRARLTYVYRPRATVPGAEPEDMPEGERALSATDYEFRIFGGDDETSDARVPRQFIAIRVLPALRDVERDMEVWRRNPLRDLLAMMPPEQQNLEDAAAALAGAMAGLSGDKNVALLEQHLSDRLDDMIGARNDVVPSLGFASTAAEDLIRFVQLFIDAARRRTVADTSLGGANVLYLALLLESLLQQRKAKAFVTTILAVEEPEAHLHVTLQRHLFRHLLHTESTLILTTHSPHIAAVAPLESYVVLRRKGSQGTCGSTTAGVQLTEHQRADLERYMDQSRAELLFASCVILVEGQAETHVVPALAKACDFDLDEYGVVVASVQGTDFAPYAALLAGDALGVPYVVVTDGDADASRPWFREGGLRRAMGLIQEDQRGPIEAYLEEATADAPPSDDAPARRAELVEHVAEHGVFVGSRTLEVDLVALAPDAFEAAYAELPHPEPGAVHVAAGVANDRVGGPQDPKVRMKFLNRIAEIGKGRFAQRLAAHLEQLDIETAVAEAGIEPQDLHVLAALDAVSRRVRGIPLIEAWSTEEE